MCSCAGSSNAPSRPLGGHTLTLALPDTSLNALLPPVPPATLHTSQLLQPRSPPIHLISHPPTPSDKHHITDLGEPPSYPSGTFSRCHVHSLLISVLCQSLFSNQLMRTIIQPYAHAYIFIPSPHPHCTYQLFFFLGSSKRSPQRHCYHVRLVSRVFGLRTRTRRFYFRISTTVSVRSLGLAIVIAHLHRTHAHPLPQYPAGAALGR